MKYAVYGTLRLNQGNYMRYLDNEDSEYIKTKVIKGYEMYSLGGFPGVIRGNGNIVVDIFEVTNKNIETRLDRLEGYRGNNDSSMYLKEKTDDGEFIYIWNSDVTGLEKVENGDWVKFKTKKQYV